MNFLKLIIVNSLLFLILFPLTKENRISLNPVSEIEEINIIEILTDQKYQCRPSSKFMFYVETNLVKKGRGFKTITANIFVFNRATGNSNLLASEHLLVPNYKDAIGLQFKSYKSNCNKIVLSNGDRVLGNSKNTPYCFNELINFEAINRSYTQSKNKLLNIKEL